MDRTICDIPINSIICPPQVREHFDGGALERLAATIKAVGIEQPVSVRPLGDGRWELIFGERRLRAAKLAGMTTIPALVVTRELSEADILELQLVENGTGEDLNPVEKAKAFDRWLRLTNRPAAELAQRIGMTAGNITKITSMLLLAPDVLATVASGGIPMSSAYELARIADHAEQRRLAQEIVSGHLTRDRLSAQLRASRSAGNTSCPRRPRQRTERVVLRLEGGRRISVSGPGLSVENLVRWIEELFSELNGLKGELTLAEVASSLSRK